MCNTRHKHRERERDGGKQLKMLKRFLYSVLELFVLMFYIQLVSCQLPSDQVSAMTGVCEMFQNDSGSSFM